MKSCPFSLSKPVKEDCVGPNTAGVTQVDEKKYI